MIFKLRRFSSIATQELVKGKKEAYNERLTYCVFSSEEDLQERRMSSPAQLPFEPVID